MSSYLGISPNKNIYIYNRGLCHREYHTGHEALELKVNASHVLPKKMP